MGSCLCCCLSKSDESTPISQSESYRQSSATMSGSLSVVGNWYHGDISHEDADARLRVGAKGVSGTYLVYNNPSRPGEFVLLVYNKGETHRWKLLRRPDGKCMLGGETKPTFDSIGKLLKHFSGGFGSKGLKLPFGGSVKLHGYVDSSTS